MHSTSMKMQDKRVESICEIDFSGLRVPFIAVYKDPKEYPGKYVARVYDADKPTNVVMVKETYEEIVAEMQKDTGMVYIPPGAEDDPCLMGAWV